MKQEKEKKELTEEEKIAKTKKNFKIVGGCCIAVGGFTIVGSFINFFGSFKGYAGNVPSLIYGLIAGACILAVGIILEVKARK